MAPGLDWEENSALAPGPPPRPAHHRARPTAALCCVCDWARANPETIIMSNGLSQSFIELSGKLKSRTTEREGTDLGPWLCDMAQPCHTKHVKKTCQNMSKNIFIFFGQLNLVCPKGLPAHRALPGTPDGQSGPG